MHRWFDEPWRVHGSGFRICIMISATNTFILDQIITISVTSAMAKYPQLDLSKEFVSEFVA